MARLEEYDISNAFTATVASSERITPPESKEEVRHIDLDITGTPLDFVEGQSVAVMIPGPHEFGNKDHVRLYSIASTRKEERGQNMISLCVRRCRYIDDFSGEERPGIASNYICNLKEGDTLQMAGPYGSAFVVPGDTTCNILMIGLGTGIAPFRAFVKHIYESVGGWKGKVRLFFGAQHGFDLIYMNDERNDFALYYDQKTFKAFQALSARPFVDPNVALDKAIEANGDEVWGMLQDPKTYVYLGGLEKVGTLFDKAMAKIAGSDLQWEQKKNELKGAKRWFELLY
ncbi:MAG TPA: FAD-binding oxidoreductase [Candidatus Hydrogenedentes bacterium]|nr:FAD-binding oxidoreductase [Candidatus Hydrogenedentota bacterium]HOS01649.1 FAD-binding oxidoreductase [Candidatus Hydrogenedentota bacterium]